MATNTKTIEFSWASWLAQADPEWLPGKKRTVEYEFTARGLPLEPTGDTAEFENGMRVFRANPDRRGAYAPEDDIEGGLTWGGQQLVWPTGEALVWDGEDE